MLPEADLWWDGMEPEWDVENLGLSASTGIVCVFPLAANFPAVSTTLAEPLSLCWEGLVWSGLA